MKEKSLTSFILVYYIKVLRYTVGFDHVLFGKESAQAMRRQLRAGEVGETQMDELGGVDGQSLLITTFVSPAQKSQGRGREIKKGLYRLRADRQELQIDKWPYGHQQQTAGESDQFRKRPFPLHQFSPVSSSSTFPHETHLHGWILDSCFSTPGPEPPSVPQTCWHPYKCTITRLKHKEA